jgi:lauroyl/myristoyl acyltransferase
MKQKLRKIAWQVLAKLHHADFAWLLPSLATLPFALGNPLAKMRGRMNALLGRDWRSMALGFRHIRHQTTVGLKQIFPSESAEQIHRWQVKRFVAEAQDEYDAQLVAHQRVDALACTITPVDWSSLTNPKDGGVLMLTPHYESFFLGVAFLARTGKKINLMSSTVTHDPRVDLAVQNHFTNKYRGLEHYLNGGKVVDMELGMRPFYRMLNAQETLVMLADAPVLPNGAGVAVDFLGQRRTIAGGALRLATKTHSAIGAYVCQCTGPGQYEMQIYPPTPLNGLEDIDPIYQFFSKTIMKNPGGWWAVDLLPHMPPERHE